LFPSHKTISMPEVFEASSCPSGLNARAETAPFSPCIPPRGLPSAFQNMMPSSDADAQVFPSGLEAMQSTGLLWACRDVTSADFAKFQMKMAPAEVPKAILCP